MKIRIITLLLTLILCEPLYVNAERQNVRLKDVCNSKRRPRERGQVIVPECRYDNGYLRIVFYRGSNETIDVVIKDVDGFDIIEYTTSGNDQTPYFIGELEEDVQINVTTQSGRKYQGWLRAY